MRIAELIGHYTLIMLALFILAKVAFWAAYPLNRRSGLGLEAMRLINRR